MRRNSLSAQLFAEFVGTTVLILFGDGVVANVVFGTRLGAGGYNWDTITLGWAFAVVMAVYVAGGITGAHINPAVTLAAILHKSIAVSTGLLYMVAQVVGAFFGALLVYILYAGNFAKDGYKNVFYTGPAGGYENLVVTQYLTEIIGTFCLLLFIYAIVDSVRNVGPGANLWPFMVGMGVLDWSVARRSDGLCDQSGARLWPSADGRHLRRRRQSVQRPVLPGADHWPADRRRGRRFLLHAHGPAAAPGQRGAAPA